MKLTEAFNVALVLICAPWLVSSQVRVGELPGVAYADQTSVGSGQPKAFQARNSMVSSLAFPTLGYGSSSQSMFPGAVRQISRTIEYRDIPQKPAKNPAKVIEIGPSTNAIRLHFTSATGPMVFSNTGSQTPPMMRSFTREIESPKPLPQTNTVSKPIIKNEFPKPLMSSKPLEQMIPASILAQDNQKVLKNEFTESMSPLPQQKIARPIVLQPASSLSSLLQPTWNERPNYFDVSNKPAMIAPNTVNLVSMPMPTESMPQAQYHQPITYVVPPYQVRPIVLKLIDLALLNQMLDHSVQLGSNYHFVPIQLGYPEDDQELSYKRKDNIDEKFKYKLKTPYEQTEVKHRFKQPKIEEETLPLENEKGKDFMEVVVEESPKSPTNVEMTGRVSPL